MSFYVASSSVNSLSLKSARSLSSSPLSALSQSQHAKAESDLQKYKEAAKLNFPFVGSVVTVMAGHCCDDTYKALTASASGFKILRQNGTEFTLSG